VEEAAALWHRLRKMEHCDGKPQQEQQQQEQTADEVVEVQPPQQKERFTSRLLLTNEEIAALGIPESNWEQFRRMRYQAAFGIESWYDELREHTFYTKSVPLSFKEALALNRYHYSLVSSDIDQKSLTDEEQELVRDLEERIHSIITSDGRLAKGAFIKLDTRSPKDVVIYDFENEAIKKLVREEMIALYQRKFQDKSKDLLTPSGKINLRTEDRDDNAETTAFVVATSRAMKVTTGKEALYLLARSSRISEDLNKIFPYGEEHFSIHFILREWIDQVIERPQYEFRAFVHQNSLNAMSQYFCFCKYDELIEREEQVSSAILDFFDRIKDRISHTSYVIDFYLRSDDEVMIIELNPFHNGAGAALFSWAKDRERFMHGPFEFRVTKELKENPKTILPVQWVRFMDSCFVGEEKPSATTTKGNKGKDNSHCVLC